MTRKKRPFRGASRGGISGYRYYSTELGRWINRDPIGEEGGSNLYCFVLNNPANLIDPFGFDHRVGPIWGNNGLGPNPADAIQGEIKLRINDYVKNVATGSITVGLLLYKTGELRLNYADLSAKLKDAGLSDSESRAVRDAFKAEFRAKQTILGKAFTEKIRASRKKSGFLSKKSNPSKTNVKINAKARVMKSTGRAFATVGILFETINIVSAPEGERLNEAMHAGGRVVGGLWFLLRLVLK